MWRLSDPGPSVLAFLLFSIKPGSRKKPCCYIGSLKYTYNRCDLSSLIRFNTGLFKSRCFLKSLWMRCGRLVLQVAFMPAIQKVNDHSNGQPGDEANKGNPRQAYNQDQ